MSISDAGSEIDVCASDVIGDVIGDDGDIDADIWGKCYKTFYGRKLRINKLERLFLASLSSLVYSLRSRPGAYPRVKLLKGVSLG